MICIQVIKLIKWLRFMTFFNWKTQMNETINNITYLKSTKIFWNDKECILIQVEIWRSLNNFMTQKFEGKQTFGMNSLKA